MRAAFLFGYDRVDGEQLFEDRLELVKVQGVGAVGFRVGRVVVDFEKDAVDAGGYRGTREYRDKFRLAAGDSIRSRRCLHGVGGVENHGSEGAQNGKRAQGVFDRQVTSSA